MRFIQRLVARWWSVWAALIGIDTTRIEPLPPPLRNPTTGFDELVARARQLGVADGRDGAIDAWTFGAPDDEISDRFDPKNVLLLREERNTAILSHRAAQRSTHDRVAKIRDRRNEAERHMNEARAKMAGLVRGRPVADDPVPDLVAERDEDADADADATQQRDEDRYWEGETKPLGIFWRLLILALIVGTVELYVYRYVLTADVGSLQNSVAVATSILIVVGPFVSGLLMRDRQATGSDQRIGQVILVVTVAWLIVVGIVGSIRGAILESRSGSAHLHILSTTVVVMFVALLLLAGAMSFMLGLARRHPYQDAFVRHRRRRDRLDMVLRTVAVHINPAYIEPAADTPDPQADAEEAICRAYAAAEQAYFSALISTRNDPAFTDAVNERRGLRFVPPPPRQDTVAVTV